MLCTFKCKVPLLPEVSLVHGCFFVSLFPFFANTWNQNEMRRGEIEKHIKDIWSHRPKNKGRNDTLVFLVITVQVCHL